MASTVAITANKGSAGLWALCASVMLHLVAMLAFCLVHMGSEPDRVQAPVTPQAAVRQVERMTQTSQPRPKPRVSEPQQITESPQISNVEPEQIFTPGAGRQVLARGSSSNFGRRTVQSGPGGSETVFFGSGTGSRRISYVVDCSGSMHGFFSTVSRELIESVSSLEPDQYFAITFFGNNELMEFSPGRMLRASPNTKARAVEFINSAGPEGKTSALRALRQAGAVRDDLGRGPEVIYFLTDGFELTDNEPGQFVNAVEHLLENNAPQAIINVIAIWPEQSEIDMLRELARRTNGDFRLIESR